jgi:hypothetical protein
LEKGEVAILTGQFGALVLAILLLSNFASGANNVLSTPTIGSVYWGSVSANVKLTNGVTNTETVNAANISVYYALAVGTSPASVSAVRLCSNAPPNPTGQELVYTNLTINYSSNSFTFNTTGQSAGQTCTYTLSLTDSLQQVVTWVATVKLKA